MSQSNERLESSFNSTAATLRKAMGGKGGEGAENKYGEAYQQLVKAGLRPQLRKKYR